jgi:hypothetical protein
MRAKKTILLIALAALVLPVKLALADPAPPQDSDQLSKLSAEFGALLASIPRSVSPWLDSSGADCMVGQGGSVWVLPYQTLFLSPPITRTCSIPEGVSLFVQLVDAFAGNNPGLCGQGREPLTVEQLRAEIKPVIDGVTDLSLEVDGNPVRKITRVFSDPYVAAQPADNFFIPFCPPGQSPAGIFSPVVDDGFNVLLPPLSVGPHTLHYTASIRSLSYTEDVTYDLTVVPVSTK